MKKHKASVKLIRPMKNEADIESTPEKSDPGDRAQPTLVVGLDYYLENGLMVFTAHFLSRRGYCCDNGCRHCPYEKGQNSPQ